MFSSSDAPSAHYSSKALTTTLYHKWGDLKCIYIYLYVPVDTCIYIPVCVCVYIYLHRYMKICVCNKCIYMNALAF